MKQNKKYIIFTYFLDSFHLISSIISRLKNLKMHKFSSNFCIFYFILFFVFFIVKQNMRKLFSSSIFSLLLFEVKHSLEVKFQFIAYQTFGSV